MLKIGEKAPQFTLYSDEKQEVSSESFKDSNLLLLFFPMAFSSVCSDELGYVNDQLGFYADNDCKIVAISVDSVFVQGEYKKSHGLNFPLLSDFNKEVMRAYGVVHEDFAFGMRGVAKRSAFLIDKKGILKFIDAQEDPGNLPDFDKLKQTLESL